MVGQPSWRCSLRKKSGVLERAHVIKLLLCRRHDRGTSVMRTILRSTMLVLLFGISLGADCESETTGESCEEDIDCNDGLFCNGPEICLTNTCQRLPPPDCNDGIECTLDSCNEGVAACINSGPDEDGDGELSAACRGVGGAILGSDCDDNDANRFPGNFETCDPLDHDEDCDPATFGSEDFDDDGYFSAGCCNEGYGRLYCGSDCDDTLPSVFPGSQVCDSETGLGAVKICGVDGLWEPATCEEQRSCLPQPNGLGVCF